MRVRRPCLRTQILSFHPCDYHQRKQHPLIVGLCAFVSVSEQRFTWRLCLSEGFWVLARQANIVTGECQDSLTSSKSHLTRQGCQWGF